MCIRRRKKVMNSTCFVGHAVNVVVPSFLFN